MANISQIILPNGTECNLHDHRIEDIDTALSNVSVNPVQNRAVTSALNGKAESLHSHVLSQITDFSIITNSEIDAICV